MKTNPSPSCAWHVGFFALALASNTVSGYFTLSPVAVVGSDLGISDPITPYENMINQSGISAPFVSGVTDFDTYFANPNKTFANLNGTNNWQSKFSFELPLKGYVDLDLGASYKINKIAIWNVSVKDVTVKIFDDLNGPGQIAGSFILTDHWHFFSSYPVDVVSFGAVYRGRYVRLEIESAYTVNFNDPFAYANIGEVVVSADVTASTSPTLDIIRNPNGDITVTFTGTLQTTGTVDGTFVDVAGNPQGIYMLPKASLSAQQYFRAQGN
ncbi:MAG: hypothetical protein ABI651_10650 [Verrucomicrobiota bacterium]